MCQASNATLATHMLAFCRVLACISLHEVAQTVKHESTRHRQHRYVFTCRRIAPSQSAVGSHHGCPLLIDLGMHRASLWQKNSIACFLGAYAGIIGKVATLAFHNSRLAERMHRYGQGHMGPLTLLSRSSRRAFSS